MILACENVFYLLKFKREKYNEALSNGSVEEDGVEEAFKLKEDFNESILTGQWIGECFIYTNTTNRLNYLVGTQTFTISHFDQQMYLLGYLPRDERIYVADKDVNVVSFALSLSVIEYQTLVTRNDMDRAAETLENVPSDQMNKIARFLEGQGHKELALEVATDPEHRFDLALSLNNLPIALEIAKEANVEHRWKTVGDAALTVWDVALAEECFTNAKDLGSLLLLYTSTANSDGMRKLIEQADLAGLHNVAFSCLWQLADVDGCIDLLLRTNRTAEAVLFAQTYKPSRAAKVAMVWKAALEKDGKGKVARVIGIPPGGEEGQGDDDLFPEWDDYLRMEKDGLEGILVDVGENQEQEEAIDGEPENGVPDGDEATSEIEATA